MFEKIVDQILPKEVPMIFLDDLLAIVTDGPWEPWFNRTKEGDVSKSGVDTKDREAGIAETILDNIVIDDKDRTAIVDTVVMASAWSLFQSAARLWKLYTGKKRWSDFNFEFNEEMAQLGEVLEEMSTRCTQEIFIGKVGNG